MYSLDSIVKQDKKTTSGVVSTPIRNLNKDKEQAPGKCVESQFALNEMVITKACRCRRPYLFSWMLQN
jgi:hypothetical protein